MTQKLKTILMKRNPQSGNASLNQTCHGSSLPPTPLPIITPVPWKPVGYYEPSTKTSQRRNSSSRLPRTLPPESLLRNGKESSRESPSISTTSSRHSTMLSLTRRAQAALDEQRSLLESLNRRNGFQLRPNGQQLGERLQRQYPSLSPTAEKNCSTTVTTLNQNSLRNTIPPITNSSFMTSPSETKSQLVNNPYSQTFTSSLASTQPSSCLTASRTLHSN